MQQVPANMAPQLPAGFPHGLPLIENVSCVLPESPELGGLFIGNFMGAQNVEMLKERGIRAVLTTSVETPIVYPSEHIPFHMRIEAHDRQNFSIGDHFEDCLQFIDKHRRLTNVYVHCYAGVSRSASIVIAYIMKSHKWPYDTALKFLKHKRSIVNPNQGFSLQLREYEKSLGVQPALKQAENIRERTVQSTNSLPLPTGPNDQVSNGLILLQHKQPQQPLLVQKQVTTNSVSVTAASSNTTATGSSVNSMGKLPPLPKMPPGTFHVRSPVRDQGKMRVNSNSNSRQLLTSPNDHQSFQKVRLECGGVGTYSPVLINQLVPANGVRVLPPNQRSASRTNRPSFSTLPISSQQQNYANMQEQRAPSEPNQKNPSQNNTSMERKTSVSDDRPQPQKISMARNKDNRHHQNGKSHNESLNNIAGKYFQQEKKQNGQNGQMISPKGLPGYRPSTNPPRENK